MSEIERRCHRIRVELVSWIEFIRELDISKLHDAQLSEICVALTLQHAALGGVRPQAILFEQSRRMLDGESSASQEPVPTAPSAPQEPVPTAPSASQEPVPTAPSASQEPVPTAPPAPQEPVPTVPTIPQEAAPTAPTVPQEPVPTPKKPRGRPKKKVDAPVVVPAPTPAPVDEDPLIEYLEKGEVAQTPTISDAELAAWAKERIRPDVLAAPYSEVETVDFFCSTILCDNALCARDNTVIRIPRQSVDKCYVQYRCSDCGERGQVLFSRTELDAVIAEGRVVDYDLLIANQPKFAKAFEQAKLEFLTPRKGKIQVPKNRPKLIPKSTVKSVPMTPIVEARKEYFPEVKNDLDMIESTEDAKRILNEVLEKAAPMSVNLVVSENELMVGLMALQRDDLVRKWEEATGKVWHAEQDVTAAARDVARSVLGLPLEE